MYNQWLFRHDPFSLPRSFLHLLHPRSPLSTPLLLRNAFFSPYQTSASSTVVKKVFEEEMPVVESMRWPLGLMSAFTTPGEVLAHVQPSDGGGKKVLLIAGELDALVTPEIVRTSYEAYREAAGEKADGMVEYVAVEGSGHHVMLDWRWKEAAEIVLRFLDT